MVNEHYVQESYLRLFAPGEEGLVSRYSLVEQHGGGDYYDPIERYPVKKAASSENYAEGLLESDATNRAEKAMVNSLRKLDSGEELSDEDIANISQFVSFQRDRSPAAKIHHRMRGELWTAAGKDVDDFWESVMYIDGNDRYIGFQHMGWMIVENATDLPFFTSDMPVVVYREEFPEDREMDGFDFDGKEVYCPLSPDKLLVLLDPNTFQVGPQYPHTEIESCELSDRQEVWKLNMFQGINAFQEVFGPVEAGEYLETLIEGLCQCYPDEDYIRANRWSTERIYETQKSGIREADERPNQATIPEGDWEIMLSHKKTTDAKWMFSHSLEFIDGLRREEPISDYW